MNTMRVWPLRNSAVFLCAVLIAGCGGGGGSSTPTSKPSPPPPLAQYSIGGTDSALVGTGLVLQDNGGDNLSVSADGSFTFKTMITSGGTYDVTVLTQPSSPAQTCQVTNASGTATANVTNVAVDCGHNEWTWMGGSKSANAVGVYGTLGTAAAGNIPGGRAVAGSWIDTSGNVWLFGGLGYDSAGTGGYLNDLWKYSNGEWTWMGGSDLVNQAGVYGTEGVAAAANIPPGLGSPMAWIDSSGNFWLFGGYNYNGSGGARAFLNALWKYSTGEWTWMGGSDLADQAGVYGTEGVAAAANTPGARIQGETWTDASGNLWLFGGVGYDSAGTEGILNDLWKYSNGEWTWVGGSDLANQVGVYGTKGVAAAANIPGARSEATIWTDALGNVWLFGGYGYDSAGTGGYLNDLWKYSNGEWTWMGGSDLANQAGAYGTEGVASASNLPPSRYGAVGWTDSKGDFWLFGGANASYLSDLWEYRNGEWTWMSGPTLANQVGTYGTMGTANPGNIPGSRRYSAAWVDAQGNLWLFGGHGYDSAGTVGQLNDLWKYEP